MGWKPPRPRVDRPQEDAALAALDRGDPNAAVTILSQAYRPALFGFILRIVKRREAAEDLLQQVFYEALVGIARFERRSSLWSWLCGIAYHRSLDDVKRARRAGAIVADIESDVLDRLFEQPHSAMDDDRLAIRRALETCLAKLPDALRGQIMMRYNLGLSYAEIGEIVGATEGTVQVRVTRYLPKLQQCLRTQGVHR